MQHSRFPHNEVNEIFVLLHLFPPTAMDFYCGRFTGSMITTIAKTHPHCLLDEGRLSSIYSLICEFNGNHFRILQTITFHSSFFNYIYDISSLMDFSHTQLWRGKTHGKINNSKEKTKTAKHPYVTLS